MSMIISIIISIIMYYYYYYYYCYFMGELVPLKLATGIEEQL